VRNFEGREPPEELEEVVAVADIEPGLLDLPFLVALTTPAHRHAATADARARGFTHEATLLDPTAVIPPSSEFGLGSYVNAGVVVGAGTRSGVSCSVNRTASVGHHNALGDFVSIGSRAVTAGECRVETGAYVGVGATVAPRVSIGANAVVGAGAVVIRDVAPNTVVVGNPARVLRQTPGYDGVGVPLGDGL